jgi:hypothetical protein
LRQVQGWINRWIIHPIDPELSFRFVGLDAKSADSELKRRVDEVSHYLTINEVRADAGLEPLKSGGDIIMNQTFVTALMGSDGAEGEVSSFGEPEESMEDEGSGIAEESMEDDGSGIAEEEEDALGKSQGLVRVSVEI